MRNVFSSRLPQSHQVPHEMCAQIDPVMRVSDPKMTPRCIGT